MNIGVKLEVWESQYVVCEVVCGVAIVVQKNDRSIPAEYNHSDKVKPMIVPG